LDFIGTEVGATNGAAKRIGVQVKCHGDDHTPADLEWLKFMSGCTLRRVAHAPKSATSPPTGASSRDPAFI
jgi:hypothetical protein